jgi:hypothetical protein
MTSHKDGLTVSIDGGLRFKKRPSAYNVCIGKALEGGHGGGRYDKAWQQKFANAAKSCAGHRVKKVTG